MLLTCSLSHTSHLFARVATIVNEKWSGSTDVLEAQRGELEVTDLLAKGSARTCSSAMSRSSGSPRTHSATTPCSSVG